MCTQKKKLKTFTVNDLDGLQKEFYRSYDPDYWLYRIHLLKNCHDNFDNIKSTLTKKIEEVMGDDYKRMLRTELHFLYFQMIETLFEIIFAISEHDNRDLWVALTFSNDRSTYYYSDAYKKIAGLKEYSDIFTRKIRVELKDKKIEIPLLRWILYFIYPTKLGDEEWKENLKNIRKLLLIFARDFTNRGEYNAYKHSLRFYNTSFDMAIGMSGSKKMHPLGSSMDCVVFLEEYKKKNSSGRIVGTGQVARTNKPFDFERDYDLCILIYGMLKNIICTRKYTLLKELHGKNFPLADFVDLDVFQIATLKTGVTKSSFTV